MKWVLDMKPVRVRLVEQDTDATRLAKKIGIDKSTLYNYFHGRTQPTTRIILAICNALDLNPARLFVEDAKK